MKYVWFSALKQIPADQSKLLIINYSQKQPSGCNGG